MIEVLWLINKPSAYHMRIESDVIFKPTSIEKVLFPAKGKAVSPPCFGSFR